MALSPQKYREYLQTHRSHPTESLESRAQTLGNDSFNKVYASIVLFIAAEYVAEKFLPGLPTGICFPVGYLLFWTFFYTFYKPDALTNYFESGQEASLGIIMIGGVLWLLQKLIQAIKSLVLFPYNLLFGKPKLTAQPLNRVHRIHAPNKGRARARQRPRSQQARTQTRAVPELPTEIEQALLVLGLPGCRDWQRIHNRYRELAKRFHPDLNPNETDFGHRFIKIDRAYKTLRTSKQKHFRNS